jgi:hypothetical protein
MQNPIQNSPAASCPAIRAGYGAALLLLTSLALLLAAWASPYALAGPEPAPVPKRWQLDVEAGPMRLAVVNLKGLGPRAYFYLTYKVINNSGQDLLFAPAWDLATDQATVFRSGKDVPVEATKAIIDGLDNPFLQDQISIIGTLLQGKENARQGVVIWPARDLKVEYIQVFGAGFSGETATIEAPDPQTGQPRQMLLRKSLLLRYRSPGELNPARSTSLDLTEKRWIMR